MALCGSLWAAVRGKGEVTLGVEVETKTTGSKQSRAGSRRLWATLLASLLVLSVAAPPALAEPPTPALSETQQRISTVLARRQQVLAQLSILEPQVEIATEEYNYAAEQLKKTNEQLTQATNALEVVEQSLAAQRDAFNQRLIAIYRSGEYGAVDLFLSTDSVSDLIGRLEALVRIGNRDAEVVQALAREQQAAEEARDQLAALQQQQIALELKAAQAKAEAEAKQKQLNDLMAQLDAEFQELLERQAREQQALSSQMVADIRAASSKYGIVIAPGSPVETALQYLGVPYVWGGETPKGFDCSGLVMYVLRQHGVELPHYSRAQAEMGVPVDWPELAPGDLVFFGSPIHHVGMYIGGGYYIHAPRTGDFVKISRLADRSDFACARRYPWVYKTPTGSTGLPTSTDAVGE